MLDEQKLQAKRKSEEENRRLSQLKLKRVFFMEKSRDALKRLEIEEEAPRRGGGGGSKKRRRHRDERDYVQDSDEENGGGGAGPAESKKEKRQRAQKAS